MLQLLPNKLDAATVVIVVAVAVERIQIIDDDNDQIVHETVPRTRWSGFGL